MSYKENVLKTVNLHPGRFKILFVYFLCLMPLLSDVIMGIIGTVGIFSSFSAGEIIRGTIVVISFFIIFHNSNYKLIIIIVIFLFVICLNELFIVNRGNLFDLKLEINILAKLVYPILLSLSLFFYMRRNSIDAKHLVYAITVYGILISLVVLISLLLGKYKVVYQYSYGIIGIKGIFLSPNDGAHALLISLLVSCYLFFSRPKLITFLVTLLILLALGLWGTRVAIGGAVMVPLLLLVGFVIYGKLDKKVITRIKQLLVLILFAMLFSFVSLKYISSVFVKYEYIKKKFMVLLQPGPYKVPGLTRFYLTDVALDIFGKRGFFENLTGEGVCEFMNKVYIYSGVNAYAYVGNGFGKRVEVDWVDIAGFFGFPIMILIHLFYLKFWVWEIKYLVRRKTFFSYALFVILTIFIFHSILAGHAMYKPLPAGAIAPVISMVLLQMSYRDDLGAFC